MTSLRRAVAALLLCAGPLGAQDRPLSLLDVPFVSQSEALCGGAAVAMVFRYWGARGVSAEEFAPLIDTAEGGIRTSTLAAAVRARGWPIVDGAATPAAARREVGAGRPVIALIEVRPNTFHYVVVVGWHDRAVVLHDPAAAPFRVMTGDEFERRWRAARSWMLVIGPQPDAGGRTAGPVSAPAGGGGDCGGAVAEGVRQAQAGALERAEALLTEAVYACRDAAPRRELAGVRLLQRRWREAGELAAASLELEPGDAHATRLLATSRFVEDDPVGALTAWNSIGEPVVDLVRIDGLDRTRHRVVEGLLGIRTGALLTPPLLLQAERGVAEMPAALSTRVAYAPVAGGLAEVRGTVVERPLVPRGAITYAVLGARAAASRSLDVSIAAPTGGGELISAGWRFWPGRPRYSLSLAAPAPWGGVWRVEGFAERQPFEAATFIPDAERTGGRLAAADWITGHLRWEVSAGVDLWRGREAFGVTGAALQFKSTTDVVRLEAAIDQWIGGSPFHAVRSAAFWRSSPAIRGTVVVARTGFERAGARAPLDVWPAADPGHARTLLLRAHPVLDSGQLTVDRLGRTLVTASLELQRWKPLAGPFAIGGAAFVDTAATRRRLTAAALADADIGAGARVAFAGAGVLRFDASRGLRDGRTAISAVWTTDWTD